MAWDDNPPTEAELSWDSLPPEKVTQGLFGTHFGENSDLLRRARIPAQLSREGLKKITDLIPDAHTRSVPLNIALNTPKTLAEIGSEFSAGTLDPETALTAGALKGLKLLSPAINGVGRQIGSAIEGVNGLEYKNPGILAETTRDPGLPFGQGLDKAREAYKGVQDLGSIREGMKRVTNREDLVKQALAAVDDSSITPDEALAARKSVFKMKKTLPEETFHNLYDIFDNVAKEKFAEADALFKRAIKSEALRQYFPVNKTGGTSIAKLAVGGATVPHWLPLASPAVAGLGASAIGGAKMLASPLVNNPMEAAVGLNAWRNQKR